MRITKELCDRNCNECEAIQNKQVALLLNVLALRFGEEIWWITNRICPNLTCCPICHIDDFCHDELYMDSINGVCAINELGKKSDGYETCEVAEEAMKVFEAIEKEKKEFQSENQRLN